MTVHPAPELCLVSGHVGRSFKVLPGSLVLLSSLPQGQVLVGFSGTGVPTRASTQSRGFLFTSRPVAPKTPCRRKYLRHGQVSNSGLLPSSHVYKGTRGSGAEVEGLVVHGCAVVLEQGWDLGKY